MLLLLFGVGCNKDNDTTTALAEQIIEATISVSADSILLANTALSAASIEVTTNQESSTIITEISDTTSFLVSTSGTKIIVIALGENTSTTEMITALLTITVGESDNNASKDIVVCQDVAKLEQDPTADEPTVEDQTTDEPTTDEPTVEDPTVEDPTVEDPTTDEPTAEDSTTDEPTTEDPTVDEPTTEDPTTEDPTVDEPTVEDQTIEDPTTEDPTTEDPTVDEPTADKPTTEDPTVEDPTVDDPTVDEPTVDEPTADEPTADEPTADEPTVDEPTVDEPTADDPTTTIAIGDVLDGGIVYQIATDGSYAMVVSMSQTDAGLSDGTIDVYTDGISIDNYDGATNTANIASLGGFSATTFPAVYWCTTLGDGWYLPARYELEALMAAIVGDGASAAGLDTTLTSKMASSGAESFLVDNIQYYSSTFSNVTKVRVYSFSWDTMGVATGYSSNNITVISAYHVRAVKKVLL